MAQYRFFGTFRFLLAICVVLQHFGSRIAPDSLSAAIGPLALGNCAVLAFFVLSGFIIAEAGETFYEGRPGAFLVNRFLRLVPPFLVAMSATIAVYLTLDGLDDAAVDDAIFSRSSIVGNYLSIFPGTPFPGTSPGAPHALILAVWALRVELMFYVLFALCLALWSRFGRRGAVLLAAAFLTLALFVLHRLGAAPRLFDFGPYFVLGVALYHALAGRRAAGWIVAASLAAIAVQFSNYDAGSPIADTYDRPAQFALLGTMLASLAALALVRGERWRGIDQRLGDMSYAIYLNHAAVQAVFWLHVPDPTVASFVAAVAVTLLYAAVMLAATEPPLRYLRDQVRGRGVFERRRVRSARLPVRG
jgi:peptidoglycan/LPS O-acetylase OafA/YrhL